MTLVMHQPAPLSLEPYDGLTLRIERLYQCLLELERAPELEPALLEILALLADVTRCSLAYVEVRRHPDGVPIYALGTVPDPRPRPVIGLSLSRGLLRAAFVRRTTVEATLPADLVLGREATVAVCAPLRRSRPIGCLYLESNGSFSSLDRQRIEVVARHLASVTALCSPGSRPTLRAQILHLQERRVGEALELHPDNLSHVARLLGVARSLVYRVHKRISGTVTSTS
jgi:hypothetical protein